jgi:nucleotide-binding universal stress UspA family protein
MFRYALVALKPAPQQQYLVEFAVSLALRHNMELAGVSVIDEYRLTAPEPVPLGGGAFKTELDLQRLEDARQGAEEAAAALAAAAQSQRVRTTVEVCDGDVVEQVVRRVHAADCLICGHTAGSDASERSLLNSILSHNPRPAIVVPDAPFAGHNIMVAYDGSFQSSRALREFAISNLCQGRNIAVVSLHKDIREASRLADEAVSLLKRHGIAAVPYGSALSGNIGRQLLAEAKRLDAGLLVMGAFGHHSVRTFFFGSTTSEILNTLPIPVFLDH